MLAKLSVLLKTIFLLIAVFSLFFSFVFDCSNAKAKTVNPTPLSDGLSTSNVEELSKESAPASDVVLQSEETTAAIIDNASPTTGSPPPSSPTLRNGNATLLKEAPAYIKAIMDPEDTTFPRLECPIPNAQRYRHLKFHSVDTPQTPAPTSRPTYFFALNLHQRASLLPGLFSAIVESMRYLGPQNCALSVIEGRSDDGTFEILLSLREEIECIGAKYFFNSSDVDPEEDDRVNPGDRVKTLAELRNQALQPLLDLHHHHHHQHHPNGNSNPTADDDDTTIIFLNDVALCSEDILELIHQRRHQSADMVCGLDWTSVGPDPTFYDVWIARGLNGDTFFSIPPDGSWDLAWNLFPDDPFALESLWLGRPFQVFSCWNGAAVFTAKPYLDPDVSLRFRRSREHEECPQGEPKTWCADLWRLGYGRIAVVPIVHLEYGDEAAMRLKEAKGYVSNWLGGGDDGTIDELIRWETEPPERVKCMPSYANQTWLPWDGGGGGGRTELAV